MNVVEMRHRDISRKSDRASKFLLQISICTPTHSKAQVRCLRYRDQLCRVWNRFELLLQAISTLLRRFSIVVFCSQRSRVCFMGDADHFTAWTWSWACIFKLISFAFIRVLIDTDPAQPSIFASLAWTVIRALGLGRPASHTSLARPSSFGVAARNL